VHGWLLARRYPLVIAYLAIAIGVLVSGASRIPQELFPRPNADYLQIRVRAPQGTDLPGTERLVRQVVGEVTGELGPGAVTTWLADVGSPPPLYPSDAVYVFNAGPDSAQVLLALAPGPRRTIDEVEEAVRRRLASRFPSASFAFERADVLSQVLGVESATPVDVVVVGQKVKETRRYAEAIRDQLARISELRDVAIPISLDAPSVKIDIDRERAAQLEVSSEHVGRALASANWSSQMVSPLFWVDPSGDSYFVAVRADPNAMTTLEDLKDLPVMAESPAAAERPLLRDVAAVDVTKTQGEFVHWDSRRCLRIVASASTKDLAGLAKSVRLAIAAAGAPPTADTKVIVRGQIQQMEEALGALKQGLALAVVVVLLLLAATFQSARTAFAVLTMVPAVLGGVVVVLAATRTSLNVQSAIGAIMAIGVAMANSVLLAQFFHDRRRAGAEVGVAAAEAVAGRLRAILMTSACMLAGMTPMALGLGDAGEQNAALGRAVIGGLVASTAATLLVLPAVLSLFHRGARERVFSLDVRDPASAVFVPADEVFATGPAARAQEGI
jgi:multidrug efflux pump subunit AcrB